MRCFTHAHALVAVPMAIMIVCSLAAPFRVQADPPPGGDALLKQSVAAMRESLRAVHATGSDRWTEGQTQAKLRVAGDCVMQPVGIRSLFHSWGTRLTSAGTGKMAPERYDRQFIVMLSSDS